MYVCNVNIYHINVYYVYLYLCTLCIYIYISGQEQRVVVMEMFRRSHNGKSMLFQCAKNVGTY